VFDQRVKTDQMQTVLTEYFWNMGWCDPCAAQPLSRDELRSLGVFWLDDQPQANGGGFGGPVTVMPMIGGQMPVMLTRLHVRYSASTFPEDLVFQETQDTQNYQARYVIRHPWQGTSETCPAAKAYNDQLEKRHATEAQTLVSLTGWDSKDVFKKVGLKGDATPSQWWQSLWPTPD
jgi:hypothetical protein